MEDEISVLRREIQVLKETQIKMAQAMQTNLRVFSDGFQMVDCHIHVLQKAFKDHVNGFVNLNDKGEVDFADYLGYYWACVGFAGFIENLKEVVGTRAEEPLISSPNGDTIVFGGL